jgi:hypothetical protein
MWGGGIAVDQVGWHVLVMKFNQEALTQRKAQMGHFQQTLNAAVGGGGTGLTAPFPHLAPTSSPSASSSSSSSSSSSTSEVSNLRRQRVLEGLPEPINSFVCNVQWPDGVTYKKVRYAHPLFCTFSFSFSLSFIHFVFDVAAFGVGTHGLRAIQSHLVLRWPVVVLRGLGMHRPQPIQAVPQRFHLRTAHRYYYPN